MSVTAQKQQGKHVSHGPTTAGEACQSRPNNNADSSIARVHVRQHVSCTRFLQTFDARPDSYKLDWTGVCSASAASFLPCKADSTLPCPVWQRKANRHALQLQYILNRSLAATQPSGWQIQWHDASPVRGPWCRTETACPTQSAYKHIHKHTLCISHMVSIFTPT